VERAILHSDCNSFYASAEILMNPKLRGKPVSVCGSVEERHGIVLASNPIAKKFGVKTGDAVWQATQKCKELVVVPPHMDLYLRLSKAAKEIYREYTDKVESYGLDECYLDISGTGRLFGPPAMAADDIRKRVHKELGITVSVGVSNNKIWAKAGSDYKKPDAVTLIDQTNYKNILWPLPASDLMFVGPATTEKLHNAGIDTIGQLANFPVELLERRLGKNGIMLWRFANGFDDEPVGLPKAAPKSISNGWTPPQDLKTAEDIKVNTMFLSDSVASRLRDAKMKARTLQVALRFSNLFYFERQEVLPYPTCTAKVIGEVATKLILTHWKNMPLRSITVRTSKLIPNDYMQLSLLPEVQRDQKQEILETTVQNLRSRFGRFSVDTANMLWRRELSSIDIGNEASAQSLAFYKGE